MRLHLRVGTCPRDVRGFSADETLLKYLFMVSFPPRDSARRKTRHPLCKRDSSAETTDNADGGARRNAGRALPVANAERLEQSARRGVGTFPPRIRRLSRTLIER